MIGPMMFHAIRMYVDFVVLGRYSAIHAAVFSKSSPLWRINYAVSRAHIPWWRHG